MKIKYNPDKDTVTIKNLPIEAAATIYSLLSCVRLGQDTLESESAFEILEAFEAADAGFHDSIVDMTTGTVIYAVAGDNGEDSVFIRQPSFTFGE